MTPSPPRDVPSRRPSTVVLRRLGTALALCGLAWVFWQIATQGWDFPSGTRGRRLLLAIAAGACLYGLSSWLLAGSWWWLTGVYGGRLELLTTSAVWARTQIAKYLPGNVFHYVGRQALGRRIGLRHEPMVAAHLLEAVAGLGAAGLIMAGGLIASRSSATVTVSLPLLAALTLAGLLAWPAIDAVLRRIPWTAARMADLPRLSVGKTLRLLAPATIVSAVFFLATGAVVLWLARAGWPAAAPGWIVVWLYAPAWAAGTLTPGAPGGLGVREAALTLAFAPMLGAGPAATLALAVRAVTLLGDVVTYGLAWLVPIPDADALSEGVDAHG